MRITVKPRIAVEVDLKEDAEYVHKNNIISIYSMGDSSPIKEDSTTVLKLLFDDITDKEVDKLGEAKSYVCLFTTKQAEAIHTFANNMDTTKELIVHCDAGISRSGAVGSCLNLYINKYKQDSEDYYRFFDDNNLIMPNPYVTRVLMRELFYKEDK